MDKIGTSTGIKPMGEDYSTATLKKASVAEPIRIKTFFKDITAISRKLENGCLKAFCESVEGLENMEPGIFKPIFNKSGKALIGFKNTKHDSQDFRIQLMKADRGYGITTIPDVMTVDDMLPIVEKLGVKDKFQLAYAKYNVSEASTSPVAVAQTSVAAPPPLPESSAELPKPPPVAVAQSAPITKPQTRYGSVSLSAQLSTVSGVLHQMVSVFNKHAKFGFKESSVEPDMRMSDVVTLIEKVQGAESARLNVWERNFSEIFDSICFEKGIKVPVVDKNPEPATLKNLPGRIVGELSRTSTGGVVR